jgi:hypothetical protein
VGLGGHLDAASRGEHLQNRVGSLSVGHAG